MHACRLVERARAHIPHLGSSVFAENRNLASRTAEDSLRAAIVARYLDRLRSPSDDLHTVSLDHQIDHKCASSLALTVQTMTAMDEKGIGLEPIPNRAARAAPFTINTHDHFLEYTNLNPRPIAPPRATRSHGLDFARSLLQNSYSRRR
jgi:hypothetical protein